MKTFLRTIVSMLLLGTVQAPINATGPLELLKKFEASMQKAYQSITATSARKLGLTLAAGYAGHKTYEYLRQNKYQTQKKHKLDHVKLPKTSAQTVLFAHGLGGDNTNGMFYKKHGAGIIPGEITTFNFQDAPVLLNRKPACLAQTRDIECLKKNYEKVVRQNKRVVLMGVSRGAAAVATFMGTHTTQNVDAIIMESPFDEVQNVVQNFLENHHCGWIPGLKTLGSLFCSFMICPGYSIYGIRPIDVIGKIQHDVPVFIVCSIEDSLTPASGSIRLYNALKAAGHPKAHLIVVQHGIHAAILWGPDGKTYLHDLHAFFRHYGLKYNPTYADKSKHKDFKNYQESIRTSSVAKLRNTPSSARISLRKKLTPITRK